MHYCQPTQQTERDPRRPSLCQPSNWAADMLKHCYFNSSATVLWKQYFFPLKNTEVLLLTLIQNRLFSIKTSLRSFIFQNASSKFQTIRSVPNNPHFYSQSVPLPLLACSDVFQYFSLKGTSLVYWELLHLKNDFAPFAEPSFTLSYYRFT